MWGGMWGGRRVLREKGVEGRRVMRGGGVRGVGRRWRSVMHHCDSCTHWNASVSSPM